MALNSEGLLLKIKEHFKVNKKQILLNFIAFTSIFTLLLFIDLLTKGVWYDSSIEGGNPDINLNYTIFEIKNLLNKGTYVFGNAIPYYLLHTVSILIVLVSLIVCCSSKNKEYFPIIFALGCLSAGAIGNMYDRITFAGVRDIFVMIWGKSFLPAGTFNFADVCLGYGAIFISIYTLLIIVLLPWFTKKQNKETNTDKKN
ncbi:signal peptidase II [Mycoplasma phocoenae]|uniref:Signal peptidase II n=1 Tax=Mycoplasma phocoenae TaxID=754517 RepID=A0A858U780_9MOLU|nr:signal peptidase II [Mycoplasma phocoenae]QJG67093.1 signal peptidase II [Mycoplasma phocoenae]